MDNSLKEMSFIDSVYKYFVPLSNSSVIYRDEVTEIKGYYLNWNDNKYNENPIYSITRFFPIKENTKYIFPDTVHSYIWFDSKLNFLGGNTTILGESPNINPTSPSNSSYVRVNFIYNNNIGMYEGDTIIPEEIIRQYVRKSKISQIALKPIIYDNNDNYPIESKYIDNGISNVILSVICDVEYEEGYDYSFAIGKSEENSIILYSHKKEIIPASLESIKVVEKYVFIEQAGKYIVLGNKNTRSRAVVDWSSLKGIKSWNNLYVYHGLGLNPSIFRGNSLFQLYDKIQSEMEGIKKDLLKFNSLIINEEKLLNEITIGNGRGLWGQTTSTFSGWGEPVGILPSGMNAFGFKVRSREKPIKKIRFTIYENSPSGIILEDVYKDVNIEPNDESYVIVELPTEFNNSTSKECFVMYRCDQFCDLYLNEPNSWLYQSPIYPISNYSINGNLDDNFPVSGEKTDLYFPLYYGEYKKTSELINQKTTNDLYKIVSSMTKQIENISNSSIFGKENGTWNMASSVFSGWGEIFGSPTNFDSVAVMVRARSINTKPITEIRIRIREGSKGRNGKILYYGFVDNLNIDANDIKKVIVKLNNIVINPNSDLLWIEYLADNLLDQFTFSGYPYVPSDDITYTKCAYSTNGDLESKMSQATSPNGYPFTVWYGMYEQLSELTDDQIQNISERLFLPDPYENNILINLPDVITAVVGDILQLFFRGMIASIDPYIYDILITCSKGNKYTRYFQFTPTSSDIGDIPFKLSVKDNNGKLLGTSQSVLKVRSATKSPDVNVNICCFGDSLTSAGKWCAESDRRLTGSGGTPAGLGLSNITFCGSKKNGTTGYFGEGGWTWIDYTTKGRSAFRFQVSGITSISLGAVYINNGRQYTVSEINITSGNGNILCDAYPSGQEPQLSGDLTKYSGNGDEIIIFSSWEENSSNPLWNEITNAMDFIPYANDYCSGKIDSVYTLLSWNGQSAWRTDFSSVIENVKIFADALHRDFPNAKLKIMGIQIPSINGGMGMNYGASGSGYADGYGMVITALNQNKAYQDFANKEEYKRFVEFVNVSTQVDSEYNMPYSLYSVNSRNNVDKEIRGTNGVHPSESGYFQIGDIIFRNVIKEFCQSSPKIS